MKQSSIKVFYSYLTRAHLWDCVSNVKAFDEKSTSIIRVFRHESGLTAVYASHSVDGSETLAMECSKSDTATAAKAAGESAGCSDDAIRSAIQAL